MFALSFDTSGFFVTDFLKVGFNGITFLTNFSSFLGAVPGLEVKAVFGAEIGFELTVRVLELAEIVLDLTNAGVLALKTGTFGCYYSTLAGVLLSFKVSDGD
jgi:hypothetical protein